MSRGIPVMNKVLMEKLEAEHIQKILENIYEKSETNLNMQASEVVHEMVQHLQTLIDNY